MGGTHEEDEISQPVNLDHRMTLQFDAIVTLHAWAHPADWGIQEFRYGIPDGEMSDIDLGRLRDAVAFGLHRWSAGDRILVRCQAGLNRSGLVTGLILMCVGFTPEAAIAAIRSNRADVALCNPDFEEWLLREGRNFVTSLI